MKKINLIFLLLLGTIFLISCGHSNYNIPFIEGTYETDEVFTVIDDLKITKSDGTVKEFGKISFTKMKISFRKILEEDELTDKNVIENRYDHKKYLVEIYVKINDSEYILANYQKSYSQERDIYHCELEFNEYFGDEVIIPIRIDYYHARLNVRVNHYVRVNGEPYEDNAYFNSIYISRSQEEDPTQK